MHYPVIQTLIIIIIWSKFFFLFIGREPTTWPANKYLQIMVCSCAMPSNCVWLQIIFCTCVKETVLFSFLQSLLHENGSSLRFRGYSLKKQTLWLNDKSINYWTCMVIAKYWDLSVSRRSIICLSLRLWEIIDLLATEKKTIFCSTLSNKLLIICVSNNLCYLHVYVVLWKMIILKKVLEFVLNVHGTYFMLCLQVS